MSVDSDRRRQRLVLAAMTLANAMILVDQTAVPLALPNIMKTYGIGSQEVQWVLNGSLLPLAGLLVFGGRLGDLIGLRRVFLAGALIFVGGSALGGVAPAFPVLLAARVVQGVGGALMLPTTVAIVSTAFPAEQRGRALGAMGGAAAVFAALGPTIGGLLTSAVSWRAVLLVNLPLAAAAILPARRHLPVYDEAGATPLAKIDASGTLFLSMVLVGMVFGLSQSQAWGWDSPAVLLSLTLSVAAVAAFVVRERRAESPLVDFALLRHRNYLGASISQLLGGMVALGLGVIFPLLLILNLEMSAALAGLALIPTTLPMIAVAPLAGRWYDRAGGRPPLITGFGLLALSGVLLAVAVGRDEYLPLLPGLVFYGIGLSLVLSTNDPVTLDMIAERDHGQAAGVSATAEQFGGALGIAVLYSIFHATYVDRLHDLVNRGPVPGLTPARAIALRNTLQAAEASGLRPRSVEPVLQPYLLPARAASNHGYSVTFIIVALLAVLAGVLATWLVRKPAGMDGPAVFPPRST